MSDILLSGELESMTILTPLSSKLLGSSSTNSGLSIMLDSAYKKFIFLKSN